MENELTMITVTVSNVLMDLRSFAHGQASLFTLLVLGTPMDTGTTETNTAIPSISISFPVMSFATAIGSCGQEVRGATRIRILPCITMAKSSVRTKAAIDSSDL